MPPRVWHGGNGEQARENSKLTSQYDSYVMQRTYQALRDPRFIKTKTVRTKLRRAYQNIFRGKCGSLHPAENGAATESGPQRRSSLSITSVGCQHQTQHCASSSQQVEEARTRRHPSFLLRELRRLDCRSVQQKTADRSRHQDPSQHFFPPTSDS